MKKKILRVVGFLEFLFFKCVYVYKYYFNLIVIECLIIKMVLKIYFLKLYMEFMVVGGGLNIFELNNMGISNSIIIVLFCFLW